MKSSKQTDISLQVEQLKVLCRALKLAGVHREMDRLVRDTQQGKVSPIEWMIEAFNVELASRDVASVQRRLHEAKFAEMQTLEGFEFSACEGIDEQKILALCRCQYVHEKQNVLFVGPVGTGKTHLATALGVAACRQRHNVAFYRTSELVRTLVESKQQKELGALHKRLERVAVLVLDEMGFVPFDREGAELLFNVLALRHRKGSTIITSNLAFGDWPQVFAGDEKLTAALLDRLAENAVVITTGGDSYRTRKRRGSV